MKNFWYKIIFILVLIAGCKKSPLDKLYYGTITGLLLNNKPWPRQSDWIYEADGYIGAPHLSCTNSLGAVDIHSYTKDKFLRENIALFGLPLQTGKVVFTGKEDDECHYVPDAIIFLAAEEGDALVGTYAPLHSVENSVTITSYNSSSGDVSGTFDITFIKRDLSPGYYSNYTDTVRFSGGQFKTRWIK